MGSRLGEWVVGRGAIVRIVLCGVLLAHAAVAQVVVDGILYDDSTGAPVRGAVMFVDPSTDAAAVHVYSDSAGRFSMSAPAGTYRIAAVRAGYLQTLSAVIALADGERMDVRIPISATGDVTHGIAVVHHVRSGGAVRARSSQSPRAGLASYDSRAGSTLGLRFDRAALANAGVATLGEFLQGAPGVSVGSVSSAASMQMSRGGSMTFGTPGHPSPSDCHVGWFVDGHRMDSASGVDPITDGLASMQLATIEGIEVFRGISEMPPDLARPDLRCGAIAIWTRRQ